MPIKIEEILNILFTYVNIHMYMSSTSYTLDTEYTVHPHRLLCVIQRMVLIKCVDIKQFVCFRYDKNRDRILMGGGSNMIILQPQLFRC